NLSKVLRLERIERMALLIPVAEFINPADCKSICTTSLPATLPLLGMYFTPSMHRKLYTSAINVYNMYKLKSVFYVCKIRQKNKKGDKTHLSAPSPLYILYYGSPFCLRKSSIELEGFDSFSLTERFFFLSSALEFTISCKSSSDISSKSDQLKPWSLIRFAIISLN